MDGRVGFTGGVGVADNWLGHAQDPEHWRDSHFRLEGPAVAQMQAAFMANWMETCAEVLHGGEYFPELEPAGPHAAQLFMSSAYEASESVRLMYLLSIASAVRSVRIANAYFVPDSLAVATLVDAQRRGATVEIIVPNHHIDSKLVRRSFRLNDEANLNILDRDVAAGQMSQFEQDMSRSRRVTLEEWRHRPWRERVSERLAGLLRLQL